MGPKRRGVVRERSQGKTRASRRPKEASREAVPDVFQDMLSEAGPEAAEEDRPLKKRKVGRATDEPRLTSSAAKEAKPVAASTSLALSTATTRDGEDNDQQRGGTIVQTIIDESEDTDESDIDWEEVEVGNGAEYLLRMPEQNQDQEPDTLEINVGNNEVVEKRPLRVRRKAATAKERTMRLDIHKLHVLCLLYHTYIRNSWCNNPNVQSSLKRFLSTKMATSFMPNPQFSQFQASRAFIEGLSEAKDAWKNFKLSALGIKRAKWANEAKDLEEYKPSEDADPVLDVSDLRKAAVGFEGSPDTGAQLFCAFLRAAGVDARLVCSLQPLPFAAGAQASTPSTLDTVKPTIYAENTSGDEAKLPLPDTVSNPAKSTTPVSIKRIRRMGQSRPNTASTTHQGTPPAAVVKKNKAVPRPRYPVYWVEAFNAAHQKWIPVDPIATMTVGKPSKLEPPLNDPDITMSYAIAFEANGVAKDVTRRYVKAYNAKTRKFRVEATENGEKWWKKAMKIFRRREVLDRDQVEDAELAKREVSEEMPKNVQDFKDHPYYVLERHLRHNEVIYPKREVGKVNVGSAALSKLEPIYRRRDVHALKSADKWYRLGREVKPGEQPLKHAKPRRDRFRDVDPEQDPSLNAEEAVGAGLYADFQTELYVPPPIVNGRVPRNGFGNLDVYVPSMIPQGGAHIRHRDAMKAARILGIDYAAAVTGFQFKGRHGTAIIQGIVVASEYQEVVESVIEGLGQVLEEEEENKRSVEALRLWRRFMIGLRIKQQVQSYASASERDDLQTEIDRMEVQAAEEDQAGGFFHDADTAEVAEPTTGRWNTDDRDEYEGGGGFLPEYDTGELFRSSVMLEDSLQLRPSRDADADMEGEERLPPDEEVGFIPDTAGGFLPEEGGGFVPDEGGGFLQEDGGGFMSEDSGNPTVEDDSTKKPTQQPSTEQNTVNAPTQVQQGESASRMGTSFDGMKNQETFQEQATTSGGIAGTKILESHTYKDSSNKTSAHPDAEVGSSKDVLVKDLAKSVQEPSSLKPQADESLTASEDEKGSLLSHDPEDEDAEPEWLLDDLV